MKQVQHVYKKDEEFTTNRQLDI